MKRMIVAVSAWSLSIGLLAAAQESRRNTSEA